MSKIKDVLRDAKNETDAVVAAVETVRMLTTESKRLLAAKEYDALEDLFNSIEDNAENIVAATFVGSDLEDKLDHEWLADTSVL